MRVQCTPLDPGPWLEENPPPPTEPPALSDEEQEALWWHWRQQLDEIEADRMWEEPDNGM